jgi:uncharacterized membrane protein
MAPSVKDGEGRTLRVVLGVLAAAGLLISAYLTYLEVFVTHAICQWCVASAAIMVAALICAALAAWRLIKNER